MSVLNKKLYRDFTRLWAQAIAISLVMACGVATMILAIGTYRSLDTSREAFYDRYRFGTVFANLVRAPIHLKTRIAAIPGVSSVELRISEAVLLDIKTMSEPASGIALSIPDFGVPAVNRLYLRSGRLPQKGRGDEVAVVEAFAEAHGFKPGDQFQAIINGKKSTLTIVGIVLSPEFIYAIGPGDIVPDQKRFGVFFMSEQALQGLFDMENAFNNISLTSLRNADKQAIIDALDLILKPYGGAGAYERKDQISDAFLSAELDQLKAMASVIPPIFLAISAFLVNMILSRLITLEREQIGLLKALGYSDLTIGAHYAKLVIIVAIIGLIIGSGAGFWLGRGLTRLYANFFSFPFLIFRQSFDLYLLAGSVTVAAALAGAAKSIASIVALPPAVAMRPPAPQQYRSFIPQKFQFLHLFSQLTIMAFRHLFRHPVRSVLTTIGTSLSVALLIAALFTYDSIDHMIDTIYFQADRQDATVTFTKDQSIDALSDIMALPSVMLAEPFRTIPVMLRNGHIELRMAITGLEEKTDLGRILDIELKPVPAPAAGLLLSDRVAKKLHVRPGDQVDVVLVEKNNRFERVTVTGIVQSYVGLNAFMQLNAMNRLMRDGRLISGARILINEAETAKLQEAIKQRPKLYEAIKQTPAIASIALQNLSRDQFRATIEENVTTMTAVYVALAVIITLGVIYNSARIQLSERANELASLRVFGFSKAEVSSVLLIELFTMILAAQPIGWLIGFGLAWSIVTGFETDLFRIPLIINTSTYAWASLIVLAASLISAMIVRRRVDALDLIQVLKTRE